MTISAKVLMWKSGVWIQGTGSPPSPVQMALSRPYCGCPAGCQAYTKRQMTDAPTSEIASGRKTNVLATDSCLTRSNKAAMSRPRPTEPATPTTSQRTLLKYMAWLAGVVERPS